MSAQQLGNNIVQALIDGGYIDGDNDDAVAEAEDIWERISGEILAHMLRVESVELTSTECGPDGGFELTFGHDTNDDGAIDDPVETVNVKKCG